MYKRQMKRQGMYQYVIYKDSLLVHMTSLPSFLSPLTVHSKVFSQQGCFVQMSWEIRGNDRSA